MSFELKGMLLAGFLFVGILVLALTLVVGSARWPKNTVQVNVDTIGLHNAILANHEARIKELEIREVSEERPAK